MPATSPYSPNDYQAVSNFRPYELPVNDIFKAISAQNQFWDAGAARVKAYYDNGLNLKLSLEPNKEIRKKYMDDAEKQLTKLSSMDLSDPAVQRQGFALFKPLFQDEGIIYDDLTTRHYEKVRNDGLMYRSKDNGKGYSDINMQYAMQGYNEFVNSKDRMAGKGFYENRKEYTPYYDYTDDFSKSLKDCKPSSIETTSPSYGAGNAITGYMKETYTKSLSSAQVRGCLEAGLSPNASRQLQIEGAVMYKNNIPVLASDTATYLGGVSANYSTQLQQLAGQKAAIMSKKDMSDKEKALAIQAIDESSKALSNELDVTNRSIQKINAGDYTDIQNGYENYAGSIYSYKKLLKKASASAFEEVRNNYKADPVQLNAIKFSNDKYLQQMDQNFDVGLEVMKQEHDKEMKLLDLMYGGKDASGTMFKGKDIFRNPLTGEITINPDLLRETANLTEKPEINKKIYQELTDQVSRLNEQDSTNNLKMYNSFLSRGEKDKAFRETVLRGFNYGTTDDEWTRFKNEHSNNKFALTDGSQKGIQETPWFKTYTEAQPDDEDVNKWANENTVIESGLGVINRKLELGEKEVATRVGGDFRTQLVDNLKNVKPIVVAGTQLTPMDIQSYLEGSTTGKFQIKEEGPSMGFGYGAPGSGGLGSSFREKNFYVNGVKLDGDQREQARKMLMTVQDRNDKINKRLGDARVDVYNKLGFDREPWFFTPSDDKKPPAIVQTLRSVLPKDEKGKDLDVSVISSDFSGGIRVSVPGVRKGKDDMLDQIRQAGVGTSVEATGDNIVTIRGTNYNLVQQAVQNPVLAEAAYQLNTISQTTAFAQTQPGAKVANTDIKVPIMIRGKQQMMTIETYKNDVNPEFRVYLEGANTSKPIITASNPYELFEKISRSPMDLNKPIR